MFLEKCLKICPLNYNSYRVLFYCPYSTVVAEKISHKSENTKNPENKPKRIPIIESKRPELNFFGRDYAKNAEIPCVSTGWSHKKSRDDYFIVRGNASKQKLPEKKLKFSRFDELGLHNDIIEVLARTGITDPTEIQIRGIPIILEGYNTQIAAETGCGKTLAYLLPIIQQVRELKKMNPNREGFNTPLVVIITPLRDLAQQIALVAKELCKPLMIDVDLVLGGHTKRLINNPKFKEVDILVATIGAMNKLISTQIYNMSDAKHVVVDEADTMFDDSFSDKLVSFMSKFPIHYKKTELDKGTQFTVVSATMPKELPDVVSKFVDPNSMRKVVTDNMHKILPHVEQKFLRLRYPQKPLELLKLVKDDVNKRRPVMIFSNSTPTCDWISLFLNENKVECININGKMLVDIKRGRYEQFRDGKVNVLSCTDIASRGLDTTITQHIINYDFPNCIADYIHRCGRTGRLGSVENCRVTNFVASPRDVLLVQKIELSLRRKKELPSVDGNTTKLLGQYFEKLDLPFLNERK